MTLRTISSNRLVDGAKIDNLPADVNAELAAKQDTLVSGTNIKTINGTSVLGSGDITISSGGDLQDAYDAGSLITTDATNTSVKIKTGSGADTDVQLEVQNASSQKNFTVTGEGDVVANDIQVSGLTASELMATDSNKHLVSLPVATYPSLTELSYVKGVTSGIQNQLGSKIGTTLGAVGSSPNSNGATVTGTTLNLEPANLSNPGVVTATAQTFGGVKSFANTFVDATGGANRASSLEIANTGNLSEFVITDAINLEVTDNFNHGTLAGVFFTATQSGNGNIDTLGGALGAANNDGTGTISLAIGAAGSVENSTTGAITEAVGVRGMVTETAGTITDAYAFKVEGVQGTNAYGFYNATAGSKNVLTETHILASDPLKFFDSDNSNYVAFKAPATVGTDVTWTLPNADGSASQVLTTNGSGVLSWSNPGGSGDVSKVGTPVDNQIGVWTGDGTIEGDANLTFDTSTDTLTTVNTVLQTVKASGSAGVDIKNSGGTDVIITGAGGGTGTSIVGTTNIASASADYHQIAGGTGTITDTATGSSADININLVPKGAGRLQAGGVNVPTISSTDTLTNKRITPRVGTTTSSATPTINTDNVDVYVITAQAEDITSFTTNLSGTPTSEQSLRIAITGTAARALARGASFEDGAVTLPTTTITTQRLDVQFVWNAATSKWRCMAAGPLS